MNKILIIQSPYLYPDPTAHLSEPLGIEYLAANLRKAGHHVSIYDPTLRPPAHHRDNLYYYGASPYEISDVIRKYSPDFVGISCHYAYSSSNAYEVARIAKQISKNIITVMGGLFVSTHVTRPLRESKDLDYCIVGEADTTFPALVALLSEHALGKKENIEGLVWRENDFIKHNDKTRYVDDLDSLPFPARDLVDINKYMEGSCTKRLYGLGFKPTLSLLTSRSCPNRCSFCNMRLVHGGRWRARSADNVLEELDEMINKFGAKHVFIMDDNFTFNTVRAKTICEKMVQKRLQFRWNTPNGISVRNVDLELAKLMKRAGCANVCIAIESGSEYIRNEVMHKRTTDDQIVNAVEYFTTAGIPVVGFILLGMPGENAHHFQQTVDLLKRLTLTSIVVSFVVPFPGTDLYHQLIQQGILDASEQIGIDNLNSISYETDDFTGDELINRKNRLKSMFPSLGVLSKLEQQTLCSNT
jgi:anaerobic magnesium-protoporphyrin IX monomethyl ester cyclase